MGLPYHHIHNHLLTNNNTNPEEASNTFSKTNPQRDIRLSHNKKLQPPQENKENEIKKATSLSNNISQPPRNIQRNKRLTRKQLLFLTTIVHRRPPHSTESLHTTAAESLVTTASPSLYTVDKNAATNTNLDGKPMSVARRKKSSEESKKSNMYRDKSKKSAKMSKNKLSSNSKLQQMENSNFGLDLAKDHPLLVSVKGLQVLAKV